MPPTKLQHSKVCSLSACFNVFLLKWSLSFCRRPPVDKRLDKLNRLCLDKGCGNSSFLWSMKCVGSHFWRLRVWSRGISQTMICLSKTVAPGVGLSISSPAQVLWSCFLRCCFFSLHSSICFFPSFKDTVVLEAAYPNHLTLTCL